MSSWYTDLASTDVETAARELAGNWRTFESFGWDSDAQPADADNCAIVYLSHRDADDVAYDGPDTRTRLGNGRYRCYLKGPGGMATTVIVGAPAYLSHAVDSPEAFDDAARAALAFADNDSEQSDDGPAWNDVSAFKVDGSGWHIGRSEAHAWPKEEKENKPQSTIV